MSRMSLVVMLLLALVQGCASRGFPPVTESGIDPQAVALLQRSAERHGLAAWQQLQDVSVAYAGEWGWLVPRLQPELIDAGFRQKSEERLILGEGGLLGSLMKAALENLVRYLEVELYDRGIRVNGVCGGLVRSEMLPYLSEMWPRMIANMESCGRRWALEPEEIANVVAFLASERSSAIRGQILVATGGVGLAA